MKRDTLKLVVVVLLLLGSVRSWTEEEYAVRLERGVSIAMRDGTVLRADIYRPEAPGKFPILLERTPYDKSTRAGFALRAAAQGYVVILQDVRGRYTSDGEWYPFKHEAQDGYDTVEWAAALPYSSGKVGMVGASYVGATQLLAAIERPPHLEGICPIATASNYHDGWTYQGGAFEQSFNEFWTAGLVQDSVGRYLQGISNTVPDIRTLPLSTYLPFRAEVLPRPENITARFAPYFLDWLAHPNYDEYWREWSIEEHYADIQVPALTVAAWYDIFQGGALRNYVGLRSSAGNEAARRNQHLVITIGGHAGAGRKIGDLDFGAAAAEFNEDDLTLAWYDFLFKGAQNEFAGGKPVKIFVMGANVWREESAWPLSRAVATRYFLHSGGKANSMNGDGSLSRTGPGSEAADWYVYNPADPVPTLGGPLCCDRVHLEAKGGPRDQSSVERRKDVLVYSTRPFAHDTEVTGPVSVELYAKSSALDTDFTAKLVDVWQNGFAQNLTEGILRAKYRESQSVPKLLVPGKVYKIDIDLWSTSNVFLAGHALRLEISSSNFPRFDRNMNTGEVDGISMVKATNTILHDAAHPSVLVVPIVPQ